MCDLYVYCLRLPAKVSHIHALLSHLAILIWRDICMTVFIVMCLNTIAGSFCRRIWRSEFGRESSMRESLPVRVWRSSQCAFSELRVAPCAPIWEETHMQHVSPRAHPGFCKPARAECAGGRYGLKRNIHYRSPIRSPGKLN
jgi:hypothetical protein